MKVVNIGKYQIKTYFFVEANERIGKAGFVALIVKHEGYPWIWGTYQSDKPYSDSEFDSEIEAWWEQWELSKVVSEGRNAGNKGGRL